MSIEETKQVLVLNLIAINGELPSKEDLDKIQTITNFIHGVA